MRRKQPGFPREITPSLKFQALKAGVPRTEFSLDSCLGLSSVLLCFECDALRRTLPQLSHCIALRWLTAAYRAEDPQNSIEGALFSSRQTAVLFINSYT